MLILNSSIELVGSEKRIFFTIQNSGAFGVTIPSGILTPADDNLDSYIITGSLRHNPVHLLGRLPADMYTIYPGESITRIFDHSLVYQDIDLFSISFDFYWNYQIYLQGVRYCYEGKLQHRV
jgi:hypothetical protein